MITTHPGEYLSSVYLNEIGMTQVQLAASLKVSTSAVSRLLSADSDLSPEMAVRLSYVFDLSAEAWMEMQTQHSLAIARKSLIKQDFVRIQLP